jgi:tight adherence protein B
MRQILLILSSVFLGAAITVGAVAGRKFYVEVLLRLENDLREKLRRLRVNTKTLRVWLLSWAGFVGFLFVLMWIVLDMLVIALVIISLFVALPWYVVRRMAEQRKFKIEDQLADSMVSLSSSIKAGLSLAQALEILAQQSPKPICQEFQQIVGEYQMGKPLERCLVETKDRLKSENFALFTAAMEASRESGGRLNETVDRIAHSVRELQRLERKVESETAQARASAFYMALAPVAILAIYYFIVDPVNTSRLFTTVAGQVILSAALVLNVIAYLWARQILNPDI